MKPRQASSIMKFFQQPYKVASVAAAVLLNGCAVQSPLFDTEPERSAFVITKPPVQISYRGDISKESQAFALDVLREMQKIPYRNYRFNENHNVRLNTIDAKSDKSVINLYETTEKRSGNEQ